MTTILQVMPGDGWSAVLAEFDYEEGLRLWAEPLVSWALIEVPIDEGEEYRSMGGMVRLPGDKSCVVSCWEVHSDAEELEGRFVRFLGYLHTDEDVEEYREEAERHYAQWCARREEEQPLVEAGWIELKRGWKSPDGRTMSRRDALHEIRAATR